MEINQQKLAELARALMTEVNSKAGDNQICIARFRDRLGKRCCLNLTVTEEKRSGTTLPEFNCVESENG